MKPHGRLRCTDRRREVGRDWPEQRCALPVAPTDPSALTRVRLRACAAGHSNIDKASSGQAGDPRSLADIMAHEYGANGAVQGRAATRAGALAVSRAITAAARGSTGAACDSCARRTRDMRPALAVGGRWGRVQDHTGPC